ncbi:MAG: YhgN family NAAT transporter [Xanthomonadales bacterium]|nr:YhgN family NAAT transporter [Xanthomonadales bacterium]
MSIVSAAILLFLILDPLGNVPLFLSLLKELPPARRRIVLVRELLIAFGVLLLFLFAGQYLLALMHLRQESVSIAGGIILFLIGIKMIFPQKDGIFGDVPEGEPFIVPMAVPAVAGPSGMAAVMLMANSDPGRMAEWTLALFLAWFATAVILFFSTYLYKLLGIRVLVAVERLMGMLLVALSVQMFLDGIAAYLAPAAGVSGA